MQLKRSIQFKTRLAVFLISVVPTLVLFIFTFQNNLTFYRNQVYSATKADNDRITVDINHQLESLGVLMDSLLYNQTNLESRDVQYITKEEFRNETVSAWSRLQNSRQFYSSCQQVAFNNEYVESIYLYTRHLYNYSYNKSNKSELLLEELKAEWNRQTSLKTPYLTMHLLEREQDKSAYVLLSKNVVDSYNGQVIGMLTMVCNTRIFGVLDNSKTQWSDTYILDTDGSLLFGQAGRLEMDDGVFNTIISTYAGEINQNGSFGSIMYDTLNYSGWKIVSQITMDAFHTMYFQNVSYLLIITASCLFATLIVSVFFARFFTRPIIHLSKTMQETPFKSIDTTDRDVVRKDEIGILYRGFNALVDKINNLIQDRYIGEINLLKSRMKNLVAQINSHFVFNTLENINCLAELEENTNISVMSKSLGDMLRYSIDYEEDEAALSAEIDHIARYITIQQVRFGKTIELSIQVPRPLRQSRVLKFMLQPLVENAIEHGLYASPEPCRIILTAQAENGVLKVGVLDNGSGIEGDKLEELRMRLERGTAPMPAGSRHHSVGLINIHKRIRLLYGEKYGLSLESGPGKGTCVNVFIPISEKGGEAVD